MRITKLTRSARWTGTPTGEFITCVRAVHSSILHLLTYLQHRVYSVCFSADGKFIASGSRDKTVKIWSVGSSGTFECQSTLAGHRYVPSPLYRMSSFVN